MHNNKKGGVAVMIGMGGEGGMHEMDECCNEVMFNAPEGMDVSEMENGDEKEVLAVVKYYGDGKFELLSIDGYDIGNPEEEMPEGYEEGETGNEMNQMESYPQKLQSRAGLS
jgi:hypothetical protein